MLGYERLQESVIEGILDECIRMLPYTTFWVALSSDPVLILAQLVPSVVSDLGDGGNSLMRGELLFNLGPSSELCLVRAHLLFGLIRSLHRLILINYSLLITL